MHRVYWLLSDLAYAVTSAPQVVERLTVTRGADVTYKTIVRCAVGKVDVQ